MKITIEFDNGPALVLAPESLSLTQLSVEQIALVGTAGTYAIPIISFPGRLSPNGVDTAQLIDAVKAIYTAGHWTCDRAVEENILWANLKRAAGIPHGTAPKPIEVPAPKVVPAFPLDDDLTPPAAGYAGEPF